MTVTKKFEFDDDRVNVIDSDTGVMFSVIKVPNEGYIVDCWTQQGSQQDNEKGENIASMQVLEEDYKTEEDPWDRQDTMIPENRQGEINSDR